jgi:hypothetical protein
MVGNLDSGPLYWPGLRYRDLLKLTIGTSGTPKKLPEKY